MAKYTVTLSKTMILTCRFEIEADSVNEADAVADAVVNRIGFPSAPLELPITTVETLDRYIREVHVAWELEDESIEVDDTSEGGLD